MAISIDGKAVREVPGPSGLPYFGNYLETYPDHLGNNERMFDLYGPLFVTNNLGSRVYQTNDPELSMIFFAESDFFTKRIIPGHPLFPIKSPESGVFLGDTDTEQWRQAHKFLPPALGPKAVRHYAPSMQKTVEQAFTVFDELDRSDEAWNVYQYMLKLGSQAVGKLVLGMDFQHFDSVDAPHHEMVLGIAQYLQLNKRVASMGSWYAALPFGDPKKLRSTKARVDELLAESIAKASKGQEDLELQDAALKAENVVGPYTSCSGQPTKLLMRPFLQTTASGHETARETSCLRANSQSRSSSPRPPASPQRHHSCPGSSTAWSSIQGYRTAFFRNSLTTTGTRTRKRRQT